MFYSINGQPFKQAYSTFHGTKPLILNTMYHVPLFEYISCIGIVCIEDRVINMEHATPLTASPISGKMEL